MEQGSQREASYFPAQAGGCARHRRKSYLCGIRSRMTSPQKQVWRNTVFPACRSPIPLSHHAASTHGIAPTRRARLWIPYGPSEQSRRAPQLGQRSWHACMSIIVCPHMGHSFFLSAAIHHAQGSASYYSFWQARRLQQRPSRYPNGHESWLARPRL